MPSQPPYRQHNLSIFQDTDVILRFRLTRPANITDWDTELIVRDRSNAAVELSYTGAPSDAYDNADTVGIIDVELTANNTGEWSAKTYTWTFERTNVGSKAVLAYGELKVLRKV